MVVDLTPYTDGDFLARWRDTNCPKQPVWQALNLNSNHSKKILTDPNYQQAFKDLSAALGVTVQADNYTDVYDYFHCLEYLGEEVPSIFTTPSETKRALDSLDSLIILIRYLGNQ